MQRFLSVAVLLFGLCATGSALPRETLLIAHCLAGCPAGAGQQNEIVVRHLYAVSVNPQTRLADWVSYRILPASIGVASLLPREWENDELTRFSVRVEELDGGEPTLIQPNLQNQQDSAYRITEFAVNASDRGRLVPMTGFAGTSYWPDLNLLSIMSLMKSDLRLGAWARLDQAINALVQEEGELFVITGPVYTPGQSSPGEQSDRYPDGFFKVVARPDGRLTAFLFEQNLPVHSRYCEQLTDLASVEARAGLDLFPEAAAWPTGTLDRQLGC